MLTIEKELLDKIERLIAETKEIAHTVEDKQSVDDIVTHLSSMQSRVAQLRTVLETADDFGLRA